jgi:hypothetical protein
VHGLRNTRKLEFQPEKSDDLVLMSM